MLATKRPLLFSQPATTHKLLTLSGGLGFDDLAGYGWTRTANTQGDGAAIPAGVYIGPEATNYYKNGGAESNTTYMAAVPVGGVTSVTRITTDSKFGGACFLVDGDGGAALQGIRQALVDTPTITAGNNYTQSAWIKSVSGATALVLNVDYYTALDVYIASVQTAISVSTSFARYTSTGVAPALATKCTLDVRNPNATAAVYRVDDLQFESGSIATPYIETDGGTATRGAGRVQLPVSGLFSATQGWAAARIKTGFASNVAFGSDDAALLSWGAAQTDWWLMYLRNSAAIAPDQVAFYRQGGGAGGAQALQAISFAKGDDITVIFACDATQVKVSGGGSAFTAQAQTTASVTDTLADIGYDPTDARRELSSNILWLACGSGTLTDLDARYLNAQGSFPPADLKAVKRLVSPAAVVTGYYNGKANFFEKAGS